VHIGHLAMADEARAQFGYDIVVLVPSLHPPHKSLAEDPGPGHRLAMLRLAVEGESAMAVDDCEIRRGGTSYTIDTIRDLVARMGPEGKPGLLLGDDLIPGFPSWREPEALVREADLVCARRSSAVRLDLAYPHVYADNIPIPVSSSMVRARAASGRPFRWYIPGPVYRYIRERKLYGCG